jgi:hypothetical protein
MEPNFVYRKSYFTSWQLSLLGYLTATMRVVQMWWQSWKSAGVKKRKSAGVSLKKRWGQEKALGSSLDSCLIHNKAPSL